MEWIGEKVRNVTQRLQAMGSTTLAGASSDKNEMSALFLSALVPERRLLPVGCGDGEAGRGAGIVLPPWVGKVEVAAGGPVMRSGVDGTEGPAEVAAARPDVDGPASS